MVAGAVLVFVVSAVTFALGQADVGIAVVSCGMLVFGAGLAWLAEERRRVREVERELLGDRSEVRLTQFGQILDRLFDVGAKDPGNQASDRAAEHTPGQVGGEMEVRSRIFVGD